MTKKLITIFLVILGALAIPALISARVVFFEPFRTPSRAMLPTFLAGDYILVYKMPYGRYGSYGWDFRFDFMKTAHPQRGEVFVFKYPKDPRLDYIKRVIGLPGDRIRYDGPALYVNDKAVNRQRLSDYEYLSQAAETVHATRYSEELEGARYSILLEEDPGHEPAKGELLVPPHHYFVMGDNRDNSADSRYWGFVPEENLVGKVVWIWMSSDSNQLGRVRSDIR